ncbi:MAG: metal ABC transporter substrate-binding protein [Planctomycetota bacterium]
MSICLRGLVFTWFWVSCLASAPAQHLVACTTPDLAALSRAVGGDSVRVTSLARGTDDPHFVESRPSMVRIVNRTEVLVETGRELEIGWLPVLVGNARNPAVLAGGPGRIDASAAVRALEVPTGLVDRSYGDVHAGGSPHYLLDPLCGLQVAALLRDRFATLWPAERGVFAANFSKFREDMAIAMVGKDMAALYENDAEKLGLLFGAGTLSDVLRAQGDLARLGGWFAAMSPLRGKQFVADHDLWPYFAERFGLRVAGFFEPKPGVAPTTAHLEALVQRMRTGGITAILSAPYFAPQHAALVARATGARIAAMVHQPGAVPGTEHYIAFVDYNVRAVVDALQPMRDAANRDTTK